MEVSKIFVTENSALVLSRKPITAGTAGATVSFTFDESWDGLRRTYVWKANGITLADTQATGNVPRELLLPGVQLSLGVYGTSEKKVIPTLWVDLGIVTPGADPFGDESTDDSLPVWAQLQEEFRELKEETVPEEIERIAEEYMQANMPEDGYSPTVDVTAIEGGYRLTITDESRTQTVDILNGAKGDKGDTGDRGPKGDRGDPGASYIRDIGAGRLNEAEKAALATVDGEGFLTDPIFMESNNLDGFSRWVYKQIGVDVGAYMKSVHKTYTSMFNYKLLTVEEGADPYCLAMLVDGSYSGKTKWMQNNGYEYKLELKDYKIGDIFCMRYNDTLEGLEGVRTSCYYMALYQAENTFILYQDFGAEEEKLYPSNVKVIDYTALLDIINATENQYYYVLRPENIALMPVTILSDLNNAEAFCVGALPVSRGGTGGTTPQEARTNLGITPMNIGAAPASHNHSASNINTGILATNRLPTVPISKGGTGSTTAEGARTNLGITPSNIGALPDTLVTSRKVFASTSSDSLQKYIDNVLSTMESETNKIVFVDNDSQDPALFGLKFGGARWNLLIAKFSDNYASVFGWGANTCVYSYKKKTVWSEWMYSSPATSVGTAYPILERWDGKPVYTKIVNCGEAYHEKKIAHGIPIGSTIIRYAGVAGRIPLPYRLTKGYVTVNSAQITIYDDQEVLDGLQTYVQLWYV